MKGLIRKISAAFVVLGLAAAAQAQAPTFSVLYNFAGPPNDGAGSVAPLIMDAAGNLYGTTAFGGNTNCGSSGCGTVFKLDPSGNQTVLFKFSGTDGAFPAGGLVMDAAGNLYGTTVSGGGGGLCKNFGCGTVYKLDPAGKHTVLHAFVESTDGGNPTAGLVMDSANMLYGTAGFGGNVGPGVVFKMDTAGNETVLHSFTGTDGFEPSASLIMDSSGTLYGTTFAGGSGGAGVVFSIDSSQNFSVLHSFNSSTEGGNPTAPLVRDAAGNLYGAISKSATGALFEIDHSGNFSILHAFTGSDGAYQTGEGRPSAGLVMDAAGNLYGTTIAGGVQPPAAPVGTIFKFSAGTLTTLHTFYCTAGCPEGANPNAGLLMDANGNFYGTTTAGGGSNSGTIFKLVVQIPPSPPTITGISPAAAIAGGPAFNLTVNGTNFVNASTVSFNGTSLTTTFVSGSQLTAAVPAADITVAGSFNVTVNNPGGQTANTVSFTVVTPQAATQAIGSSVNVLFAQGVINGGQQNSLVVQLQHAVMMMSAGKNNGAIGNLESFISEVNDLSSSGVLSAAQASSLIGSAQSVIAALS